LNAYWVSVHRSKAATSRDLKFTIHLPVV
jgi:hypothetical protein